MQFTVSQWSTWLAQAASLSSRSLPASPRGVTGEARFRFLAAVSIGAVVLAIALLTAATRGSEPSPGIRTIQETSGELRVTWVMAGGYGAEAGLRVGDLVERVPVPPGSTGWQAYHVLNGSRAGLTVVLVRRWTPTVDLALVALGLEFLATGLIVFLRAADRGAAMRFTALAATISATLVAFPAVGNGAPWALAWEWVGSKAGMAAFSYFFLTFPVQRWRPLRITLLWAPALILTGYAVVVISRPDLYWAIKVAGYSYMAVGAIVSIAALAWPLVTHAPREQQRLWPVAAGTAAGVLIYLLGSLLPYLLLRQYLIPAETAILGVGLLPVSLVWSLLHYPVMGFSLNSSAVLRAFFESTSDPMFLLARDGRLVDVSRAGRELLDQGARKPRAEDFRQVVSRMEIHDGDGGGQAAAAIESMLSGQMVHDVEIGLRLPGGETVYYSLEGTPLRGESGAIAMAVMVLRDITHRKQRELTRLELERQKDEFLATVSHDLRTPLAAIKYSVGVVLANRPRELPEPLSRMLDNIDHAADIMTAQVNDLLDLARLQAGHVHLSPSECDVRDLVRRAVAAIEPLAGSRGQRIGIELPSAPCRLLVDQARLERAVTNLVANAYKHGRDGGTITLKLFRSRSQVRIGVCDDGPGIPAEEHEKIFDRFYRIGRQDCTGTGLGLPIARGMVELHGGSLSVESCPGAGATFWITLPADR